MTAQLDLLATKGAGAVREHAVTEPEHRRIAGLFWVVANQRPDEGLAGFLRQGRDDASDWNWGYFIGATLWADEAAAARRAKILDGVHLGVTEALALMGLPELSLGPVKRGKMGADGRVGDYQLPGPVLHVVDLLAGALWAAAKNNEGT